MKTLHVDLQIGFQSDSVEIDVDGDAIYKEGDVTTSLLLGVAESLEVQVEEGTHQVDVRLPSRDIASSFSIEVQQDLYLGISVKEGEIVFRLSEDSFGYL